MLLQPQIQFLFLFSQQGQRNNGLWLYCSHNTSITRNTGVSRGVPFICVVFWGWRWNLPIPFRGRQICDIIPGVSKVHAVTHMNLYYSLVGKCSLIPPMATPWSLKPLGRGGDSIFTWYLQGYFIHSYHTPKRKANIFLNYFYQDMTVFFAGTKDIQR